MRHQLPKQPGAEFFTLLRERFTFAQSQDTDREPAQEDVRFAAGQQWDPKVVKARKKRPVLTENRLGPSIAQVVNDGRQNKPGIVTTPLDGGTEETAEHFQGRIRQIEYECDADIAYDTSREQQVTCGRGFYRVTTRYKQNGRDGEQELAIDAIPNQFSVYWDPAAKKYDLSDAEWILVIDQISKSEHERRFGKNTVASRNGFFLESGSENPAPSWIGLSGGEIVQVADYYLKEYDDAGECKVCVYATNGIENLDETEWIGSTIPVVPTWGRQKIVDGKKISESLIRYAKEPQKLVNLYVSNIAEQIAQMPKTPYLAAEGQIAGREQEWADINDVARAYVQYKTRSASGDVVGPPTRAANEPPIVALVRGYLQAIDAVKATMGIFDAALGANKDDTSGVAIARRQKESDVTNFHFSDNEARSRKALGRILLEVIPIIDGTDPAEKPVRDEDGKVRMVKINQPYAHPKTGAMVHHDMASAAMYQVGVSSGPSYTSQRQEENERQGEVIKAVPELMWVIGDQYFGTSDGPGAKQMAERMKRAIQLRTPGLIEQEDGGDPQKQLQQLQQQAQQTQQMNQQLIAHVHELAQQIEQAKHEQETKIAIAQMQEETKRLTANLDRATKIAIAEIGTKAQDAARASADALAVQQAREAMAHDVGMATLNHEHDVLQAQQGHDNGQEAAETAAQQQAQLQAQQAEQQPEPVQQ